MPPIILPIPNGSTDFININPERPIQDTIQLAYVLPKDCLNLINNEVKDELLEKYDNYYEENKEINMAFCKYFWECNVVFDYINLEYLEKTILNIQLNNK